MQGCDMVLSTIKESFQILCAGKSEYKEDRITLE